MNNPIHPPRKAEIVSEDKSAKCVRDENGRVTFLVNGSMNATPYPVGTKGTIQYVSSRSYGLDFFTADTKSE